MESSSSGVNKNPTTFSDVIKGIKPSGMTENKSTTPPSGGFVLNSDPRSRNKSLIDIAKKPVAERLIAPKPFLMLKGKPYIQFTKAEIERVTKPYEFLLVGRFSHGVPGYLALRKAFANIGLKGEWKIDMLDRRNVSILCSLEEDYTRLWIKGDWSFYNCPMKIFKWSLFYKSSEE